MKSVAPDFSPEPDRLLPDHKSVYHTFPGMSTDVLLTGNSGNSPKALEPVWRLWYNLFDKSQFEERRYMSMVGRIVGLVCCLLCSFPFFIISIYDRNSSQPIPFWSGDTSLKDWVKDVKGYNEEIAGLYRKCALFFVLTGILFLLFPVVGIALLVFACTLGIYLTYRVYKRILERYS